MRRRLLVLGLSLSSSWGNGHATTYRALLKALAGRGHDILFLERDVPWYAAARDLVDPPWCRLRFYDGVAALAGQWGEAIATADAVILGSYVPDGIAVARLVQRLARGVTAFYDIDTPVTLARLAAGDGTYLAPELVPGFDLYLSFAGGPTLRQLETAWGARRARALYCSVDPELYHPLARPRRWALGYLGTYSADRQPGLERLLLAPARHCPDLRFVVAGPQYPAGIDWPANVERIEHLPPGEHAGFYSAMGWTLNLTRADMKVAGFSPSVRLFEAAACGTPILSDIWPGLDSVLRSGSEVAEVRDGEQVLQFLALPESARAAMAAAARARVLAEHTAAHRAALLEAYLEDVITGAEARLERA
ncbi:Glycosyltransferase [Rhodovastum atsumiense]|uniref:Glycosyltransferase n=1 Tax=Rhodovastum atsumiense TaxID=504468 RepID=A0A5M6IR22_9PROT|nr:glycosyltransferase [Rhodovastum atsumiense]KAA5609925.1 glycosyltransferase [Rhodovastum atsumiense]CAH2604543.1 Glycosyltransferase [Rhodovastum atsumiense]